MSSSVCDIIHILLSKYNLEIESEVEKNNLSCTICKKLILDAYQCPCACLYCYRCIVNHLLSGARYCCGGKDGCMDDQLVLEINVVRNPALNKKISKTRVICPNKSCKYITDLLQLEEHIRVCSKQSLNYPYVPMGCESVAAPKDDILTHIRTEALSHAKLMIVEIENVKNDFHTSLLDLKIKMESLEEDGRLKATAMAILEQASWSKEETTTSLYNEDNAVRITALELESEESRTAMATLEQASWSKEDRITALELESEESRIQIRELVEELAILKKENKDLRKEPRSNENMAEDDPMEHVIEARPKISAMKEDKRSQGTKLDRKVDIGINRRVDFNHMQFTINRFGERKMAKEVIYSPYFYSHTIGYKLRLKVYPRGNGSASGTHLSLYFIIGKGEYDDQLPWTFKYSFDISIINLPHEEILYSRSYIYPDINYKGTAFNKPIDKDNNGYGFPKFIASKELETLIGLKDSVTIKCTITAPL